MYPGQVRHHASHHSAGQSASKQQRTHQLVAGVDEVAQPVVDELLRQRACLHVGVHVDFCHFEAFVLQHALHRDDVRVHLSPRQRLDCRVDYIASVLTHFEDGRHREARPRVAVILYYHVRMLCLYGLGELAEHGGLAYSGHVLEANFVSSGGYELVGYAAVILYGVYGRGCDAERCLRCHARLVGPFYAWYDVAHVVQSAEYARYVDALCVFYLVHEASHVVGHGIHAQSVEAAVEHVCLYSRFVERLAESPNGGVGVLACEQVYLFKSSSVSLNA